MLIELKNVNIIYIKKIFLKVYVKMKKTIIKLDDVEIKKKQKKHQHKKLISRKMVGINKIVVSNKVSFSNKGFKYFIG